MIFISAPDFFLHNEFNKFLDHIPDNTVLVLNGDTIDNPNQTLKGEHQRIVDKLVSESKRLSIVWIYGNHDETVTLADPGKIQFKTTYQIDQRLGIVHGHDFDNVMPYHSWFIRCFKFFHRLRISIGASPVHVARYAKNWPKLYGYLRKNVTMNAVEYGKEHRFAAVACGHVHYPEDTKINGVRYLNTGSWTEDKAFYIAVNDNEIVLNEHTQSVLHLATSNRL